MIKHPAVAQTWQDILEYSINSMPLDVALIPAPITVVGHSQMTGHRRTGILECGASRFADIVPKLSCNLARSGNIPNNSDTMIFLRNLVPSVRFILRQAIFYHAIHLPIFENIEIKYNVDWIRDLAKFPFSHKEVYKNA